jgi:hypothetical protein
MLGLTGIPVEHALAALRTCYKPTDPDTRLPTGPGYFWFRDSSHSQLEAARAAVGRPTDRVRVAHFDTGYDADHQTKPLSCSRKSQRICSGTLLMTIGLMMRPITLPAFSPTWGMELEP